jgi:hypothetical protein
MRFGRELRGEKGQEDYARNAHTSELMEACWKGRKVKDVATLDTTGAEMLAKQTAVSTAELTEGVLVRVWQTLISSRRGRR